MKPDVSVERTQSEMRALDRSRIEARAVKDPQWLNVRLTVEPARSGLAIPLTDQFGRPLIALVAFVGVLLALACANIGGLLLARGAARQHELAVRLSLGASRWRLARQRLAEAALLAALGAAAALPLAAWCGPLLLRTMIAGTRGLHASPVLQVRIDAGVLGFTMVMTFVAALLFGIVPAWSVRSTTPVTALKTGAAGGHASARWGLGDVLVVLQVLLSFALLSLLQLYGSHLWHLRDRSLGFDPRSVLVVSVDTATGRAPGAITALNQEALSRLAAIPGVQSAALSGMTPISGAAGSRFMTVEGFQEPASARRRVSINSVSANYFATLGTPLVAGRDFRASDVGPARVAIANLAMVRHYFAGTMPLGVHVQLEGDDHAPLEIIGVAADAKYADVRVPAPPTLYLFYPQVTQSPSDFSLRVGWSPSSVAAGARRVLGDVFGQDRVRRVVTLTDQVDASIVPERMLASLAGFFGGMGTLLAAVGLYGLLAFTVARRTREIGLRLALGAPTSSVLTLVMARALILVGIGVAAGLPLAIWSRHLASAMVEHLSPGGWLPLLAAALATLIAGVLGAALPARRATRVDPLIALRAD
jgi:predicted permease